jgi:hypothetical protein
VPLESEGAGRESEADDAQLSLTLIQLKRKSLVTHPHRPYLIPYFPKPLPNPPLPKALRRWASDEAAGVDTLEAVAADLHAGGSGHRVAVHRIKAALDFGSRLSV